MKIMNKITNLLAKSKYNNGSVFDIASIIMENVPIWINSEINFFQIINIEDNKIVLYCSYDFKKHILITVKINEDDELYISSIQEKSDI